MAYDIFIEPFTHMFMLRGLLVAIVAGSVTGLLSSWLVLIGWSLVGDAISHAVLPGVVISVVLGLPIAVGALVAALVAVALMNFVQNNSTVKNDAAIGVVFTSLFALGLVLITKVTTNTDVHAILFGNLLGIPQSVMWQILAIAALTIAVALIWRRTFTLFAFDPIHAHVIGLNPKRISATLLVLLALTVVAAMQAVGVILVVAMLIIPGATAYLVVHRIEHMLILAPAIGVISSWLGLLISYHADASSGGIIVLTQGLFFGIAFLFSLRTETRNHSHLRR